VFRLLPIFCDFLSVFVIWELLGHYGAKHKVPITIACALSPVNFLVSAFHGNLDTMFLCLVLLAIYHAERGQILRSGIAYGLSVCVKIVPIMLVPLFFFYLKRRTDKAKFALVSAGVAMLVFLPYLIKSGHVMVTNIFLYDSNAGIWGIWRVIQMLGPDGLYQALRNPQGIVRVGYAWAFRLGVLALPQLLSWVRKDFNLLERVFLAFCLFLIFTPGFGVQYLAWLSLLAVAVSPILGLAYVWLGGVFLYRVYAFWGGLVPPYYANSWAYGRWGGHEKAMDIGLWLIVVAMLILFLADKQWRTGWHSHPHAAPET